MLCPGKKRFRARFRGERPKSGHIEVQRGSDKRLGGRGDRLEVGRVLTKTFNCLDTLMSESPDILSGLLMLLLCGTCVPSEEV
jgi:hypothetical protein